MGARLAADACLDFARIELAERSAELQRRTGAWTVKALGGWERERLLAVHLAKPQPPRRRTCRGGRTPSTCWPA